MNSIISKLSTLTRDVVCCMDYMKCQFYCRKLKFDQFWIPTIAYQIDVNDGDDARSQRKTKMQPTKSGALCVLHKIAACGFFNTGLTHVTAVHINNSLVQ